MSSYSQKIVIEKNRLIRKGHGRKIPSREGLVVRFSNVDLTPRLRKRCK
jgi:tRNA A58 N-methylase Trm61